MDTYANGLVFKPSGSNAPDTRRDAGDASRRRSTATWKKAKISEADYAKTFADADAAYARALQSLITHLKTAGT